MPHLSHRKFEQKALIEEDHVHDLIWSGGLLRACFCSNVDSCELKHGLHDINSDIQQTCKYVIVIVDATDAQMLDKLELILKASKCAWGLDGDGALY